MHNINVFEGVLDFQVLTTLINSHLPINDECTFQCDFLLWAQSSSCCSPQFSWIML